MNPSPAFLLYTASLLCVSACLMLLIVRSLIRRRGNAGDPGLTPEDSGWQSGIWLVLALLFGLVMAGYYVLRSHGLWTENDTAMITRAIESIRAEGELVPGRYLYQHGFGYQAVSIALIQATGLTTQHLQTLLYPFLATSGLILTSFVFFREVLQDYRAAALASMLLIFQPDILFVTLRGSHEKMTWPLMMMALAILYRSFGQPLRKMAMYVVLFYLVVFAIDTTNVFFGSVFLVAVMLSMTLGFILFRFWRKSRSPLPPHDIQRLMYISLSGGILIYIFIVYTYPPALANLRMFRNILDQISALLLSFEVKAQPYGYITTGWVNSQVYLILTVFTWLVIGSSFLEWLHHGWRMFLGKEVRGLVENLDWLLYAGFAIQIAISIMVDLSGVLGSNMQLRLFPSFTVVAIVLLVRALKRILTSLPSRTVVRRGILAATVGLSAWFSLASVLKSSNEPFLSNKWTFYLPAEKAVVLWVDVHLDDAELWTGVDERLATIFNSFFILESRSANQYHAGRITTDIRYIIYTELERLRAERLGIQMVPLSYWDQIYDNGQAQVDRAPLYIGGVSEP